MLQRPCTSRPDQTSQLCRRYIILRILLVASRCSPTGGGRGTVNLVAGIFEVMLIRNRYNRGWRYHTDLQVWLTSPTVQDSTSQQWLRGPFVVFDRRTFTRQKTPDEFMVDVSLLEATRPASEHLVKSPSANGMEWRRRQDR